MAQLLSPGVYVNEVDASSIVPNVSANVAFIAANFNRGPVDQPYVVTNKKEYEDIFGTPTDRNYNEWFQGYKFFDYANQLIVTRAYLESPTTLLQSNTVTREALYTLEPTSSTEDAATKALTVELVPGETSIYQAICETYNTFDFKLQIGDLVSFGAAADIGEVTAITLVDETLTAGTAVFKQIITARLLASPSAALDTVIAGDKIYLESQSHKNGGTQAYQRGLHDGTNYPQNAATAAINVDVTEPANDVHFLLPNANRWNYAYDLIKNDADFDYKYDQNELQTFMPGMKLKFFSRNPNDETIEIAIANSYDFNLEGLSNTNLAVAFRTVNGTTTTDTMLTGLFEYAPRENEFALAIKRGSEIETYIVSIDPLSVDGNNKNNYVETVINENSKLIYVVDNQSINDLPATYLVVDRFGFQADGVTVSSSGLPTTTLTIIGGRDPQVTSEDLLAAYESVEDKERYEIDVIIGTEESGNAAITLADKRKDCIAYIGARYVDTVGKKAIDATNSILNYLQTNTVFRSMFGAMFANYFRIYDKYNKKYRWISVAGDMAGIRCDVTSNSAAWWVSAGMKRGVIRNVNKLAFTPSQAQRDNLYKAGVNPIVSFPGTGSLVWGNKTLYPIASSFDRINVRTLFNTIERAMSKAARSQVFEFNDPYTRNAIMSMFNPYLSTIKASRGITDYLVVCDETNNTPDVISRNELRVDIYIKPAYAAEMILLTFTNVGTRSFSDVVGI